MHFPWDIGRQQGEYWIDCCSTAQFSSINFNANKALFFWSIEENQVKAGFFLREKMARAYRRYFQGISFSYFFACREGIFDPQKRVALAEREKRLPKL